VNTLIPEDPAAERFEQLVAALGNPALSGVRVRRTGEDRVLVER
jgi:hypothetical protein